MSRNSDFKKALNTMQSQQAFRKTILAEFPYSVEQPLMKDFMNDERLRKNLQQIAMCKELFGLPRFKVKSYHFAHTFALQFVEATCDVNSGWMHHAHISYFKSAEHAVLLKLSMKYE